MKFSYTTEDVECWRDKVYRRTSVHALRTKAQALRFIEDVGFCFAFTAKNSESPCLKHAATGRKSLEMPRHSHHDLYVGFARDMKNILSDQKKIYYGRLLRNRPTVVSLEYFRYFYALSRRTGVADEHLREFAEGNLSPVATTVMNALVDRSPQETKGLKLASGYHTKTDRKVFDSAITELQRKMYIVEVAEHSYPFTFAWETILKRFRPETERSRRISEEEARQKILQKYFENQLVGTVASIYRMFRWEKQAIFRTLGHLKSMGIITPNVLVDGKDGKFYGLVKARRIHK